MDDNSDYVKIVRLPSGRMMVVARRIKAEASKRGLAAIAAPGRVNPAGGGPDPARRARKLLATPSHPYLALASAPPKRA